MPQPIRSTPRDVLTLFRALHTVHAEALPWRYHCGGSDQAYLDHLAEKQEKGACFWAIEAWDMPVAYLMAVPIRQPADFVSQPKNQMLLDHLYVAPGFRGQGYATALIEAMEQMMRHDGFKRWTVGYYAFNDTADATYAKAGSTMLSAFRGKWLTPDS